MCLFPHATLCEQIVVNRIPNLVQPQLEIANVFVQTVLNDVLDARVVKLRPQLAEQLFAPIAERSRRRAGDGMQRLLSVNQAKVNRPITSL